MKIKMTLSSLMKTIERARKEGVKRQANSDKKRILKMIAEAFEANNEIEDDIIAEKLSLDINRVKVFLKELYNSGFITILTTHTFDAGKQQIVTEITPEGYLALKDELPIDRQSTHRISNYNNTFMGSVGTVQQGGKRNISTVNQNFNAPKQQQNMVMTALERPSFYSNIQVEEVGTMTNNPGGFSVGGSVGGNVNNVQGDNNRTVKGDNNQPVLGDNNQVTQQNQVAGNTAESLTKEDVVKLLAELETLIQGAELPADTKEEAVEDLSAAKKATEKEEPNKQRALDRLTNVAETLEKTTKTVDSGKQLWTTAKPIILKIAGWLGAAAGSSLLGL